MAEAAPTPAPTPAPEPAPAPAPAPSGFDWAAAGFQGEDLGYIQNKGWKAPVDTIQSYRNLEKLVGDPNSVVKLPKADAADYDAQMAQVYQKLGRPEKPTDYKLPVPQGHDGKFAEEAAGWFHEVGLNTKQAQALAAKWEAKVGGVTAAQQAAIAERDAAQATALKVEWGGAYDANVALVEKAATAFGMKEPELLALRQAMGPAAAMKFMQNIGSKLGVSDPTFIAGGSKPGFNGGPASVEAARSRLAELKADKGFVQRFASGDADAKRELSNLSRIIAGDGMLTI